jgi:hypothetical protein
MYSSATAMFQTSEEIVGQFGLGKRSLISTLLGWSSGRPALYIARARQAVKRSNQRIRYEIRGREPLKHYLPASPMRVNGAQAEGSVALIV